MRVPHGVSPRLTWAMNDVIVWTDSSGSRVRFARLPAAIVTIIVSPTARANARMNDAAIPDAAAGITTTTAGENVAFPLRRHAGLGEAEIRKRATARLADVGLEREYDKMPADLSGGMRKRAGLARAMALEPAILLVDEPSAGLDPITAADVDALLVGLREQAGTTLIVVTHNIPSARAIGEELIFLDEGRILASGPAEALDSSEIPLVREFMTSTGSG